MMGKSKQVWLTLALTSTIVCSIAGVARAEDIVTKESQSIGLDKIDNATLNGDTYSVVKGMVYGAGTIDGKLYNLNVAKAGALDGTGNLHSNELLSNGRLISQNQTGTNTKFIVEGTADITESTVEVTNAVIGTTYTILEAAQVNGNAITTPYSGLLSYYGNNTGTALQVTLKAANNVPNPTREQQQSYAAMNYIYEQGDAARQEAMLPLYNLATTGAGIALSDLNGFDYARSATLAQRSNVADDLLGLRLREEGADRLVVNTNMIGAQLKPSRSGGSVPM